MKQNRLYTLLQSHRKIGITLFWAITIFFGCFCFPFINFTRILNDIQKQISIINLFICLLAYAEVGLLSGYLFEKKKISVAVLVCASLQLLGVWDKALNIAVPLLSVLILIQSIQEHKEQKKASAIVGYVCFVAMVIMIIGALLVK